MRGILTAMLAALVGMGPSHAVAGADPWFGEVQLYAFLFCPVGFIPADGRLLDIAEHDTLFALIGTRYGGDGTTNFRAPTAKPIFTATGPALTQCIADFGIFPPQS
jgi:microcystin-dependent protein